MRKIAITLALTIVCSLVATNFACRESTHLSLRWPPDTIIVVQVSGNIYEVTTSPAAADPQMLLQFVWPPDTMADNTSMPGTHTGQQPVFRTVSSTTPAATPARYEPHELPLQIMMIWPPDTMSY